MSHGVAKKSPYPTMAMIAVTMPTWAVFRHTYYEGVEFYAHIVVGYAGFYECDPNDFDELKWGPSLEPMIYEPEKGKPCFAKELNLGIGYEFVGLLFNKVDWPIKEVDHLPITVQKEIQNAEDQRREKNRQAEAHRTESDQQ